MVRYIHSTFLRPWHRSWFGLGLVIESASKEVADRSFAKLREVLPYVNLDLLSSVERPDMGFRYSFQVKRPLGGIRLLLHARKHYELVVFFITGERKLRLCRAVALFVTRPKHFFVFNEFGEGFWLDWTTREKLLAHLKMRYDWEVRRDDARAWWQRFSTRWRERRDRWSAAAAAVARFLALAGYRLALILYAALFFLPAVAILAFMRLCYDDRQFRFRFFGKNAAAPRREFCSETSPACREALQKR